MPKTIYLDNAATTKPYGAAVNAMQPYLYSYYGNASTSYDLGVKSADALREARSTLLDLLNAKGKGNVYFTSGGTEADNWALVGIAEARKPYGRHIITTNIEHHAVLNTCKHLEDWGFEVTYVPADTDGYVAPSLIEDAIRDDTILISVMYANNEIGTIQPISEIGRIAHENGILFHTDAVQAFGHIPINVAEENIDLLSASAHKFGGVKGTGFLYKSSDCEISPFMHGGDQEFGLRAGTENVAGIVAMSEAAKISCEKVADNADTRFQIQLLRDYLASQLRLYLLPDTHINGIDISDAKLYGRLDNNLSIRFDGINGETLVALLNDVGVCVSTGAACTTGDLNPSHVLKAIGLTDEQAKSTIRITLNEDTTKSDIDEVINYIRIFVNQLREASGYTEGGFSNR